MSFDPFLTQQELNNRFFYTTQLLNIPCFYTIFKAVSEIVRFMNRLNRLVVLVSTVLFCSLNRVGYGNPDTLRLNWDEKALGSIRKARYENPDSALRILNRYYVGFTKQRDYPNAVRVLMEMATAYSTQARYREAYDHSWKALWLADSIKNDRLKAEVYLSLGRRYSYFKRKKEALQYFNTSLHINRDLVKKGGLDKVFLSRNFYALGSTFRELDEPMKAAQYLDSCMIYYEDNAGLVNRSFLKFERAYILSKKQQYQEALHLFREIEPWFLENYPSYLVLVYGYWADIYRWMGNSELAIGYYTKSLKFSADYKSHLDFTPLVYERMAAVYSSQQNFALAYKSLKRAKALNERYFDSRSPINRPLLEIQDAFRLEKERGRHLAEKQRLSVLEYREQVGALQKTLLGLSLLFLISIGVIFYRSLRVRHKAEKELIQKKRELEQQQADELIELRNKELTTSALKLIEKDELLSTLKKDLSGREGNVNAQDVRQAIKSISFSNTQNWKEFETRFVSVNQKFYQYLHQKFPDLTPSEQKLCALIKLNFSSKDIARLMGISVGSAHTVRYRLRKKLGLLREDNLAEFISRIEDNSTTS